MLARSGGATGQLLQSRSSVTRLVCYRAIATPTNGSWLPKEQTDLRAQLETVTVIRLNDGIGKTGDELRYHSKSEYQKLGGAQKKELHEWRLNKKGASGGGSSNDEKYKSRISSLETQLKELLESNKDMQAKICSLSTHQATSEDNANRRGPLTNPLNQRS